MANGEVPPMIELHDDSLDFSFPEIHPQAKLTVTLQRTLRIPDDDRAWPLPPGSGTSRCGTWTTLETGFRKPRRQHGSMLLPMYQTEAMWLSFKSAGIPGHYASWPFALKIATGKRCAILGEAWRDSLGRNPQNYVVVPDQPWLDGYVVEKGFIRQFVAMPLGQGYSAEEQLTGEAVVGGLQIQVFPMRKEAFLSRFPKQERPPRRCASVPAQCRCVRPPTWDSLPAEGCGRRSTKTGSSSPNGIAARAPGASSTSRTRSSGARSPERIHRHDR